MIKGASKGDGLGNKFLSNIKEVDAIVQVVRCFENELIANVNDSVNPIRDVEIVETELILKDLENIEKSFIKLEKMAKRDAKLQERAQIAKLLKEHLESGKLASNFTFKSDDFFKYMNELQLLTYKPIIYVANMSENSQENKDHYDKLKAYVDSKKGIVLPICCELESQIGELEDKEERNEFMKSMNMSEPSLNKLIRASYSKLNLVTFFTQGDTEVRAWDVKKNSTAPQAGSAIHSDFEEFFIKADVISYDDFMKYKSEEKCKAAKKIRSEGKEYIVQDGDIILFKKKN